MKNKISAALVSGAIIVGGAANPAWACVTVKGKIANNAISGSTTLGVAALELGSVKTKCAVYGVAQAPTGGPNFIHTLVCDDHAAAGQPQSQITLATSFTAQPVVTGACAEGNPFGPVSFAFQESSVPVASTGRGLFAGAVPAGSQIIINGDFNCSGGINMKFHGLICYAQ